VITNTELPVVPYRFFIRGLQQPRGHEAVSATGGGSEVVERGQLTLGRDLEHRATAVGSAFGSCPIEVSVAGLNQRRGPGAVSPLEVAERAELSPAVMSNTVP